MKTFFQSVARIAPGLEPGVYVLATGRFFSALGSGFTTFYAPIYFVNVVGLSATAVGIGLCCNSVSGMFGRIIGGTLTDSPRLARRGTLLLGCFTLALASFVLSATLEFRAFLLGNLLFGMGIGFFWPASESLIADLTPAHNLNRAYALTRLSDYVGLGLGVVLGGLLINLSGAYRALFVIDGLSYLVLLAFVWKGISETLDITRAKRTDLLGSWAHALKDGTLRLYALVNVFFTSCIMQVSTTLPLFLTNFAPAGKQSGFSPIGLAALFAWYIGCIVVFQMPIAARLASVSRARTLSWAALTWTAAFLLIFFAGNFSQFYVLGSITALSIFALANAIYGPAAAALVVELAPSNARGIYLSINSLCWAVGGAIGPPIGLAVMDRGPQAARFFWLSYAALSLIGIFMLGGLEQLMKKQEGALDPVE